MLHVPSGLSVTVAAGTQDQSDLSGSYGYIKVGWQGDLISWGKTAIAVDLYSGSDIVVQGSDSQSSALSIVQNIPRWNTELWLTWRSYDYAETDQDFDSASAVFVGGRFSF